MAKGLNVRQERFAELVASGLPASQAYKDAGYNSTGNAAEVGASNLLRNSKVMAKLAELRKETAERTAFKRQDLVDHLVAAVITPASKITASSPLAQEVVYDGKGKIVRVKSQGKLESARLLCDILGWKSPEQLAVEVGPKTLDAIEKRAVGLTSALDAFVAAKTGTPS